MNNRRRLTGVVASNKMEKTVIVEVSRSFRHPLYKKVIHKIEMECSNFYEDKFKCSASIKSDNEEIINSNCEKQDSQED